MKTRLPRLALLLSLPGLLASASLPAAEESPSSPYIAPLAPTPSRWTVDIAYGEPSNATEAAAAHLKELAEQDPSFARALANPRFAAALNPARPLRVAIAKTAAIRHETRELEQGQRFESWTVDGIVAEKGPGAMKPASKSVGEIAQDFPELGWITRSSFAGASLEGGRKVFLYKAELNPLVIDHPEMVPLGIPPGNTPTTASIDAETRLPVFLQCGTETRRYAFPPSPGPLEVPTEFAASIQELKNRLKPPAFAAP